MPNICHHPTNINSDQIAIASNLRHSIYTKKEKDLFLKALTASHYKVKDIVKEKDTRLVFTLTFENNNIDTLTYAGRHSLFYNDYYLIYNEPLDELIIQSIQGFDFYNGCPSD